MKDIKKIEEIAKKVIDIEAESIQGLKAFINKDFVEAVSLIYQSSGRVVVTGIGKSANIANKIVATLNSTGTPAIFMHAADAIHGDLGIIQKQDIVIALSKSGNTPEIKVLVPLLKNRGNPLIALTGNTQSYLGQQADYVLNVSVEKEACPNNLAPTSSTTAQLVMGDALAVALLELRNFSSADFARYHPGGSLGKKLYLKVSDIMHRDPLPVVQVDTDIKGVILEISSRRLGASIVSDASGMVGIITDGDLRRMLEKDMDMQQLRAKDIMNKNPKTVEEDTLAAEALRIMETHNIMQLVATRSGAHTGILHLHDILKEGIL